MFAERLELYKKIEEARDSKLIVYITSDRQGMEAQIGNDVTEYLIEHLDKIGIQKKISLLLHTNGGSTIAAWNIVNLVRQFCDTFEVIVPAKARSAGTLMCLGANNIVMTKQAILGPIDPSVNTPLNPQIVGAGPQARLPVSVEAIKGFLELAKHELNIKDDMALANIFNTLADKVHPLVLGEVYRAIGQIQMLAEKLLKNQVTDKKKIKEIISFLCSESGSHDYTINRREAKNMGLNIEKPSEELYNIIRDTYADIKQELELKSPYDPAIYLGSQQACAYSCKRALIESTHGGTDAFVSEGILTRVQINQNPPQLGINDQRNYEGWRHYNG